MASPASGPPRVHARTSGAGGGDAPGRGTSRCVEPPSETLFEKESSSALPRPEAGVRAGERRNARVKSSHGRDRGRVRNGCGSRTGCRRRGTSRSERDHRDRRPLRPSPAGDPDVVVPACCAPPRRGPLPLQHVDSGAPLSWPRSTRPRRGPPAAERGFTIRRPFTARSMDSAVPRMRAELPMVPSGLHAEIRARANAACIHTRRPQ
jgi:hypothetical protein